jgi:hypothetical protein
MIENERTTAVGVFEDRHHAKLAVEELVRNGFQLDQIGFVIPERGGVIEAPKLDENTKAGEGAAAGAVAGGTVGGLVGAALASVLLPGVGPVIAGGVFAGLIGGAVAGLASGGLLGALIGLSIPEEEARHYEREFHAGRTLVTVRADGRHDEAVAILRRVAEEPEKIELHPGARAARLSETTGPGPGSGSVFPGEF